MDGVLEGALRKPQEGWAAGAEKLKGGRVRGANPLPAQYMIEEAPQ